MNAARSIGIVHRNHLSGYIGNWRMTMNVVLNKQPSMSIPQEIVSLGDNTHDLSVMLSYLDDNLTVLEKTPLVAGQRFDDRAYAEARSFLKVCYLLIRMLFDDTSGIIKHFYDENEPNSGVPKSFDDLLKKANSKDKKKKLPEDLSTLLKQTIMHFPEMRRRRVALEHFYESLLVSFRQDEDGKTIPGHFGMTGRRSRQYEDIRQYLGSVLCEYQELTDNLLDHFDVKFIQWYRFRPRRDITIMQGCTALPLWWAYAYGGYRHRDLQVTADGIQVS